MIKEIYAFDVYEEFITGFSGNSVFTDPHFEFDRDNLYNALQKNNKKAYVSTNGGEITGLFVWLILQDDRYIEMLIGLSREETAIREMLAYIENAYRGYQLDFVINPRHPVFRKLLRSKEAKFEAEQQWMSWETETGKQYPHEIIPLTQKYEAQYIEKHNKDTFWTAEKVMEARDKFRVLLAMHEEVMVGYIDVTHCYEKNEPYDVWVDQKFQGKGYEQALLLAAIKLNKPKKMMVLTDLHNEQETEMLKSIGFVPVVGTNSVYATYRSK